jgi:hypothetical protein
LSIPGRCSSSVEAKRTPNQMHTTAATTTTKQRGELT